MGRKRESRVPYEQRKAFAQELRRVRRNRRLKQRELAALVGVGHDAINAWERMRRFPVPENASKVAEALDAPKLAELGRYLMTCDGPDCQREAVYNPKGGHDAGLVAFCSTECYRRRWWVTESSKPEYIAKRDDTAKVNLNRLNLVTAERDHLRELMRQNCEDCAGLGQPCPLLEGCVFIPETHLLSREQKERYVLQSR